MDLTDYLNRQRVPFEFLHHPPAFTAPRRAEYLRLPGDQVAKAVLLHARDSFLLAVLPSTRQLDADRLARTLGSTVRLATSDELAERFPNCECGRVPAFGSLYGLEVLLEETIPADSWLVFEGQTCVEAIRMRCRDYEWLESPRRLALAATKESQGFPCPVSSASKRRSNGCR